MHDSRRPRGGAGGKAGATGPGGKFILAEHVRSPVGVVRVIERLIEPLAIRFGGDHLTREPLEHLEAEGFTVEAVERSKLGIVELVRARKPKRLAAQPSSVDEAAGRRRESAATIFYSPDE